MNALNDNFGTEADLQALSKALHDRGMVGSPFSRVKRWTARC